MAVMTKKVPPNGRREAVIFLLPRELSGGTPWFCMRRLKRRALLARGVAGVSALHPERVVTMAAGSQKASSRRRAEGEQHAEGQVLTT